MEVREGYKNTEIGVIPEDWETESLGEKINVFRGGSPRPIQDYITTAQNGVNWIKIGDVSVEAKYIDKTEEKIKPEGISSSRTVSVGDLLLSNSMSFGRPYILRVSGCIHDGWLVLQEYQKTFVKDYLFYILSSEIVINQYISKASGSSVLNLNKGLVSSVVLPIPPLPEQQAIAEALSDIDNLISSLTKLINKKKNIKQGAMHELLTGKKRLEGFSGGWEVAEFNDIFIKYPTKHYQINSIDYMDAGSYPVVDQGKKKIIAYSDRKDKMFSCPEEGVIIFGDHTRELKFINFNFVIGADGTQVLGTKNDNYVQYYYYSLMEKEIPYTGYNRHFKYLLEMKFYRPKLDEQTAIANILSDMDAEIDVLEQKMNKYKAIKQGMMQELLTGKIRLI